MPDRRYKRLLNTEAIAHFKDKTVLITPHHAQIAAYEHALAFTIAQIANKDMLDEVHKAMTQAMENGTTFADFKKRLKPYLMAKGWLAPSVNNDKANNDGKALKDYPKHLGCRLKTIYHTNKSTAYAAGQWQRIQRSKEVLPYLQYMPSVSVAKRDEHKVYYGLIRAVDDPIWQSIMPPNGFGCKCWVKQLTKTQAHKILDEQAKDGKVYDIKTEQIKHPLTGQMVSVPKGISPSFNHNHDRLTAMFKLAEGKHGGGFATHLKQQLNAFMLDLITSPNFRRGLPTVLDEGFGDRAFELIALVKASGGSRDNSMALRKQYAKGEQWAVATISPDIQKLLESDTNIVWLSDDTLIKMVAHHPEQATLKLFVDTHLILKNAKLIVREKDTHISYFYVDGEMYSATIKVTQDKKEIYLLTVFKTDAKEIRRVRKKTEKVILDKLE